ncbi:hypothetical protein [Xanthobacter flavus]|uniref:hypothetical protein n=1 Tax=Xanthobacter flavus TaxID=281 RepID=UPI003729D056
MPISPEADIQRLTIALRLLRGKLDDPSLPPTIAGDALHLLDIADDAAGHIAEPVRGRALAFAGTAAGSLADPQVAYSGNVVPFAPRRA